MSRLQRYRRCFRLNVVHGATHTALRAVLIFTPRICAHRAAVSRQGWRTGGRTSPREVVARSSGEDESVGSPRATSSLARHDRDESFGSAEAHSSDLLGRARFAHG